MIIAPAEVELLLSNNLGIVQGTPWTVNITVVERDDEGVETPIDISGKVGTCVIVSIAPPRELLISPLVTISDDDSGQFSLSLTAEQTKNIKSLTVQDELVVSHYIEVKIGESRALYGKVEVSPTVIKG